MTFKYDDEGVVAGDTAPKREQISRIIDTSVLWKMLSDVADIEISIKTQLEFYPRDDELKGRRIAALIHWRICAKNLRNRMNEIRSDKRRDIYE